MYRRSVYTSELMFAVGLCCAIFDQDFAPYWGLYNAPLSLVIAMGIFVNSDIRILSSYLLGCSFFCETLGYHGYLLAFLLGSIVTPQIVAKFGFEKDLYQIGSGNLGISNMYRANIPIWALFLTGCLELFKGWLAFYYRGELGLAWCVIGNIFSPWTYYGVGGRGVAHYLGGIFCVHPVLGAVCLGLWLNLARFFSPRIASVSAMCLSLLGYFYYANYKCYLGLANQMLRHSGDFSHFLAMLFTVAIALVAHLRVVSQES